ncbi:two-component system, OmpR family, phosphate regulon sensor histidine kinase PhoR [Filimonas lacunae]|uniref:histidine kinase n=1 Tax=Filimonas lacunae TaxID=477680 RepID=A0A173MDC9_9BACT|nr:HAMP domain-containing sensor histidine kinase [Filimonas lacunae]BAV05594.1 sensor histidine kinase [Filimonas lacunae]SIT29261.1 two-component system, OmpR family, phosphate regulon sensor histidine kinase PhoR [Filimonas lacunae]
MKTTIHQLIRKNIPQIDAYTPTDNVREWVISIKAAIVTEQQKPIGLITTVDIAKKQCLRLIDCLVPKPFVQPQHTVQDVLQIMKLSGFPALPVHNENSEITGAVFIEDIVQFLYQRTEQQQAVVQTMAHDLKSPLANISSINELLQQNDSPIEENKELLNFVSLSVDLAREIINDLLLSEKLETDDLVLIPLEVNEFIQSCLPPLKGLLTRKNITLHTLSLPAPRYFMGDRVKLHRVIHNLLSNAVKYSSSNSFIQLSCHESENSFTVTISDNGIGIPADLKQYVFDKFSRARRAGTAGEGSTGLGMYITKEIIKMHKGEISFISEENRGTTFSIRLPFNPFTAPF